ncbi:hypothetical protein J2TS4_09070 [Paenibacillus sp. J2TS4]|nr:hypothetical protein J2TS4_09070 [Paenibacillus sp. J2TS4]
MRIVRQQNLRIGQKVKWIRIVGRGVAAWLCDFRAKASKRHAEVHVLGANPVNNEKDEQKYTSFLNKTSKSAKKLN